MHRFPSHRFLLIVVVGIALTATAAVSQPPSAETQGRGQQAAPSGPLAPEVYKNIQVLTDVPADQIDATMQYVVESTGLACARCHVRDEATGTWAYDSDDIRTKQTARRMMQMVYAINEGDFGVRAQCATCHAGQQRPPGLPLATMATDEEIAAMVARRNAVGRAGGARGGARGARGAQRGARGRGRGQGTPAADPAEIVGKYVEAVGGADAVNALQSIEMVGTLTDRLGGSMSFTIDEKAPNRFRETLSSDDGTTVQGFDGATGWTQDADMVTELSSFRLQEARRVASLAMDRALGDQAADMRAGRPTRLGDRQVNLLQATPAIGVVDRLYFDAETGLLARRSISTRTALGNLSEQIDYDDYRSVDGVKMPFLITRTTANTVDSFQISEIRANPPLADSIFTRPTR